MEFLGRSNVLQSFKTHLDDKNRRFVGTTFLQVTILYDSTEEEGLGEVPLKDEKMTSNGCTVTNMSITVADTPFELFKEDEFLYRMRSIMVPGSHPSHFSKSASGKKMTHLLTMILPYPLYQPEICESGRVRNEIMNSVENIP